MGVEIGEFWSHRIEIGRMEIGSREYRVRMKLHISEEICRDVSHEIAPVREGRRIYVLGRPYFIYPQYSLRVELYPGSGDEAIGEVSGFDLIGVGEREIGNAQAWHYPEDEVLILWECYLYEPYRRDRPGDDRRLNRLWDCFESFLMERFNPRDIHTPSWEPIYSGAEWEEFLRGRG
ncbi:hypothetical protein DRO29_06055, partial [Candidatus Bathyarchaeota archaeon]